MVLNDILFDRHTELFRSCNSNSDYEAKNHIQEWKKGFIRMPNILIPIQDIKKCLPDTWKAIACVLQIKPCSIKSHRSTICRPDCVQILQKCRNSSAHLASKSAEEVCDELSPPEKQAPCISLKEYLGVYLIWHLHVHCKGSCKVTTGTHAI